MPALDGSVCGSCAKHRCSLSRSLPRETHYRQGGDSLPMSNRDLASDTASQQQSSAMHSSNAQHCFRAGHGEREGPNDKTAANPASNLSCAHRRLGEHKDKQKKQGMASAQSVQSRCIFARRVRCLESPSSTELWQPQLPRPKPAPAGLAAGCL